MSAPAVPPRLWAGLFRLGRFDPNFVECFGAGRASFLASLAPLVALPLVGLILAVFSGKLGEGLSFMLASICNVLTPPVIADVFCRAWKREPQWAKFCTVRNWSFWLVLTVLTITLGLVQAAASAGLPMLGSAFLLLFAGWGIWLHVFMARVALQISTARAWGVVLAIAIGTAAVGILPDPARFTHMIAQVENAAQGDEDSADSAESADAPAAAPAKPQPAPVGKIPAGKTPDAQLPGAAPAAPVPAPPPAAAPATDAKAPPVQAPANGSGS